MTKERVLKDFLAWISKRDVRDCGVPYSCLSYEISKYLADKDRRD